MIVDIMVGSLPALAVMVGMFLLTNKRIDDTNRMINSRIDDTNKLINARADASDNLIKSLIEAVNKRIDDSNRQPPKTSNKSKVS